MFTQLRRSHFIALSMTLAFGVPAHASATRTFVATTGNDANTAANCGAATPCRTFGAALGVTNSGGELVVLNSGGYGPTTISQSVTITAIGVDASISVTKAGGTGIEINTTGNVTLNGLKLYGEAVGQFGIEVDQVGYLRLYNILIENFTNIGLDMETGGNLEVYGSEMNDNLMSAVFLAGTSVGYIAGSSFNHNGEGVGAAEGGKATVVDSSALYNVGGGFITFAGQMTLVNSRSAFNGSGMQSGGGGTFYFVNCIITNNSLAYLIVSGGTMAGTNPGSNFIEPGQGTTGTLSTPVALQ